MQRRASARLILLVAIAAPVFARVVGAQETSIRPQNDLPNPYRTLDTWAKMPGGRTWGSASAVDIDKDGVSIWVAERCGANNCATSTLDPVMKFDTTGNVVAHFGSGLIVSPHGIFVDRDGNIWVTDCNCTGGGGGPPSGALGGADDAGGAVAIGRPRHARRGHRLRRPARQRVIRSSSSVRTANCC